MLLGQRAHERGQRRGLLEVRAPAARVLGDEHDLAHAGRHLGGHLGAHVVEREAAVAPADVREGAVRAEAVAAVRYLHVGRHGAALPRLAVRGRTLRPGRRLADDAGQHERDVILARARHEGACLGQLGLEVLAVARRHAAGHDERGTPVAHVRQVGRLEDRLEALLGGRLDERARVHHDGVGRLGVVRQRVACRGRPGAHVLGVHLVLGASQRDERHGLPALAPARPLVAHRAA